MCSSYRQCIYIYIHHWISNNYQITGRWKVLTKLLMKVLWTWICIPKDHNKAKKEEPRPAEKFGILYGDEGEWTSKEDSSAPQLKTGWSKRIEATTLLCQSCLSHVFFRFEGSNIQQFLTLIFKRFPDLSQSQVYLVAEFGLYSNCFAHCASLGKVADVLSTIDSRCSSACFWWNAFGCQIKTEIQGGSAEKKETKLTTQLEVFKLHEYQLHIWIKVEI